MASQTEICNSALTLLGADTINAITDQTNSARALNAVWNLERDSELRKHVWKFSITRAQLPALAIPPVNGQYNTQFELPAGCIRVLQVGNSNMDWPGVDLSDFRSGPTNDDYIVEGGMILTNLAPPISLHYIQQITDTTAWDACFTSAFAARLARVTCFRITQSTGKEKDTEAAYMQALQDAVRANALETPPSVQADDTWVATRPVGAGGAAWIRYG